VVKEVILGDDPWSRNLREFIMTWPHYQTAVMWKHDPNIPIEDTPYYRGLMLTLEAYGSVWGGIIKSKSGVLAQCYRFKEMFTKAPNWDLLNLASAEIGEKARFYGPITVEVQDNGAIGIQDGYHRASILLALNIPLKVCVCSRSEGWQKVIDDVKALNETTLYQKILHPDFQDWPAYDRTEKIEAIKNLLPNMPSVLDLGCCYGYVLWELRHLISGATAVEINPARYQMAKLTLSFLGYETHNRDIFEHLSIDENKYDVVLALAVFHHFSKHNPFEKFEELIEMIKAKSNCLIYELPSPGEEQHTWMYPGMNEYIKSQFVEFSTVEIPNRELVCGKFS